MQLGLLFSFTKSKGGIAILRKIIFLDPSLSFDVVMPVTPPSFTVSKGMGVETMQLNAVGELNLAGGGTLATIRLELMFPNQYYPFVTSDTEYGWAYGYVERFKRWIENRTVLHFVVSDTGIDLMVLVENISYGERDGSNDVYATVTLREYRQPLPVKLDTGTQNDARTDAAPQTDVIHYTIKSGDSLWSICRKYYGKPTLYPKLAAYNGIKNPNLIITGHTLKIPPVEML